MWQNLTIANNWFYVVLSIIAPYSSPTTVTQQTVIIVLLNTYSFLATLHHHKVNMGIMKNYWYHKLSPSCMESARVEEKEARIKRKNDKNSTPVFCFSLAVGFQFCFSFPRACFRGFPEISAHLPHFPGGLQLEFWPTWSSSGRELFIFFVSVHLRCVIWAGERFRYWGIWASQGHQLESCWV